MCASATNITNTSHSPSPEILPPKVPPTCDDASEELQPRAPPARRPALERHSHRGGNGFMSPGHAGGASDGVRRVDAVHAKDMAPVLQR